MGVETRDVVGSFSGPRGSAALDHPERLGIQREVGPRVWHEEVMVGSAWGLHVNERRRHRRVGAPTERRQVAIGAE